MQPRDADRRAARADHHRVLAEDPRRDDALRPNARAASRVSARAAAGPPASQRCPRSRWTVVTAGRRSRTACRTRRPGRRATVARLRARRSRARRPRSRRDRRARSGSSPAARGSPTPSPRAAPARPSAAASSSPSRARRSSAGVRASSRLVRAPSSAQRLARAVEDERGRLPLDPLLGADALVHRVLDLHDLRDEVGELEQLGRGVAAGDDDVLEAGPIAQGRDDVRRRRSSPT